MSKIPQNFLNHIAGVNGFDTNSFIASHNSEKLIHSIRMNPDKLNIDTDLLFHNLIEGEVPWCKYGRYLSERPSFILDPFWHGGAYYVQEASSMFLWQILNQLNVKDDPSLKILDLCASPGGKSTLLLTRYKEGLVVSNETIKSRVSILLENCTRWGSENNVITSNDANDFGRLPAYFDIILADVPCSGSGLFRKHPDSINTWTENNVSLCSERQKRILSAIAPAIKNNSFLIYSTCSFSKQENEDMVDWLIKDFQLAPVRIDLNAAWNIIETGSQNGGWGYRFFPDKLKGEGFFIAVLQKTGGEKNKKSKNEVKTIAAPKGLSDWLKNEKKLYFINQNEKILIIPTSIKNEIHFLQENCYIKKAGIEAGTMKGKEFIPEHALALSKLCNESIPVLELDLTNAINYLKKKEFILPFSLKGWALIRFCGINLGWVKGLNNRINNYYPTSWRILKD